MVTIDRRIVKVSHVTKAHSKASILICGCPLSPEPILSVSRFALAATKWELPIGHVCPIVGY